MTGKLSLLLISILTAVILSLSISNASAIKTVNNTDFSMQVPNGWVYRDDYLFNNGILLTANEFADRLIAVNNSALLDAIHGGILVELAPDPRFPLKNAQVETYANHTLGSARSFVRYENATIGGDRAIRIFMNSTDVASKLGKTDIPSVVTTSYYVMHNDQPYFLDFMAANAKYYQKYLPQFEQMVKSFKFTK